MPLIVSKQRLKHLLDSSLCKFFFGSRSNVKMNVKWAISGLGASLTLNFSKLSDKFLTNVCIFQ